MVKCCFRPPEAKATTDARPFRHSRGKPRIPAPDLPFEIILLILEYLVKQTDDLQNTLCRVSLFCRGWYAASVYSLFNAPHANISRFHRFVEIVCMPVNAKFCDNGLASNITRLQLAGLGRGTSRTLVARLLRRVSGTLEDFVAPCDSVS